jgi:hypothetical protein
VKEAEEKPKVIEVKVAEERTEVESKAVEAKRPKAVEVVEPLRLEEEELEEEPEVIEVKEPETIATEPVEKKTVEEAVIEIKEEIDEKLSEEMPLEEPEPTPKGPPIPSLLPYRGSLCPAGRSATLGRALLLEEDKNGGWWVSGRVGAGIPRRGSAHPRGRAGKSGAPA